MEKLCEGRCPHACACGLPHVSRERKVSVIHRVITCRLQKNLSCRLPSIHPSVCLVPSSRLVSLVCLDLQLKGLSANQLLFFICPLKFCSLISSFLLAPRLPFLFLFDPTGSLVSSLSSPFCCCYLSSPPSVPSFSSPHVFFLLFSPSSGPLCLCRSVVVEVFGSLLFLSV